jgi:hypothetical protein
VDPRAARIARLPRPGPEKGLRDHDGAGRSTHAASLVRHTATLTTAIALLGLLACRPGMRILLVRQIASRGGMPRETRCHGQSG